ncbi:hypothetical protein Trydic_g9380 [Trypoxylus dichotomus]
MLSYDGPNFKSTNYTVIQLDEEAVLSDEEKGEFIKSFASSFITELLGMWEFTVELAKQNLDSEQVKHLMEYPKDFFQLIIFDMNVPFHLLPLIDHFGKIPAIGTSPFASAPFIAEAFGHHFCTYFPNYRLPYTDEMSFFQRVQNTVVYAFSIGIKKYYIRKLDALLKEKIDKDVRSIKDYENDIGLLLSNYDPILDFPEPIPPHIIPVGGLHATPSKKLPEDLQQILDNSKHGVIFFSLGTNIQLSWWSLETRKKFVDAFAKLKETVLWKYGGDDLTELPKNVIIRKWYPQNDILDYKRVCVVQDYNIGHKNVKLFITHNGALSTHEAMYHGVPVIGIPFFMDQINNARKVESKGIGKKVDFPTLTAEGLHKTIQEILQNATYKENAQKLSEQYKDRPETSLERAIFWIEYTLRHKDIRNLSTKGRYMSFYERENLDVVVFLLLAISSVIYLLFFVSKWLAEETIFRKKDKIKVH